MGFEPDFPRVLATFDLGYRSSGYAFYAQNGGGTPPEVRDMRKSSKEQVPLTTTAIAHQHGREFEAISGVLDSNPQLAALAQRDLAAGKRTDLGRAGMTGEQALRIALLKQIEGLTYRELAFRLVDSSLSLRFARLPFGRPIKVATLQANVKRLTPETWEAVNNALLKVARAEGIERGRKSRTDCTVVESNIHEPTDSSLLWDGVRVITRLVGRAGQLLPDLDWSFAHDRTLRAKRRSFEIKYPPKGKGSAEKTRACAYRDLLKVAEETSAVGAIAESMLTHAPAHDPLAAVKIGALCAQLHQYLASMKQVQSQTRRRVIEGEKVPAKEKIVSIFEKHTDIIVKDSRETLFGHKICLTGGDSSMILDVVIEDGNPADATLVKRSIERQIELYGRPPRQVSFDGAFASKQNLQDAKELGVKDVAFHKKCGLEISDMATSAWVFKRLRNFRAGIEGCISAMKRAFGLDRCTWQGLSGFKSYVWASVVSFNAIILARHLTA
jgi:transposase, IS5 family